MRERAVAAGYVDPVETAPPRSVSASMDQKEASSNGDFESKYLNGGDCESVYYGVHIPSDVQLQDAEGYENVFRDKNEALKVVKKYKKARFKQFAFYHEAAEFAVHGCENPNNNGAADGLYVPKPETPQPAVGEKPSQFRSLTSQNLVKLRKDIENGNLEHVQKAVWDNPKYLIGVGDTPSILQEGFRYNGLHVAAKAKNAAMCELILNTVSNVKFVRKLYVDDRNPEDRAKILLDLYLNTPDKGLHETPLHFAVKFGAVRCVEVLVSFPQCDRNLRNKHGNLPSQIICDRYDGLDSRILSESMALLLQENYYVPVLRSEDNCAPPVIGEPFSPTSPPNFNTDPLRPRLEIHAYAGPMNREGAEKFRKLWKTPPRVLNFGTPKKTVDSIAMLKLKDHEKGLERLGNNLAKKMEVCWKEYWPFLDSFVDIASVDGLEMFEAYLAQKVNDIYAVDSLSSTPPSKSFSEPNPSPPPSPPETKSSPMTELCRKFRACSLKDTSREEPPHSAVADLSPYLCVDKSLHVFARRIYNDIVCELFDAKDDSRSLSDVKQLQLLMLSYMADERFSSVDFRLVHGRLASLLKSMLDGSPPDLIDKAIDLWRHRCEYDCFSSDDEGSATVEHWKGQHTLCILKTTRDLLDSDSAVEEARCEEECVAAWGKVKACSCTWCGGKGGRKKGDARREKRKRRILLDGIGHLGTNRSWPTRNGNCAVESSSSTSSSDDEYFTPPSTPSLLDTHISDEEDDENEVFDDSRLPETEVFIEGNRPTKVDCAVYKALKYAECKLNPKDFPNIYRWYHAVGQYNENERNGWTNVCASKSVRRSPPMISSTPIKSNPNLPEHQRPTSPSYTSPKSWLRVTGANSPRASLKGHRCNVSFNL